MNVIAEVVDECGHDVDEVVVYPALFRVPHALSPLNSRPLQLGRLGSAMTSIQVSGLMFAASLRYSGIVKRPLLSTYTVCLGSFWIFIVYPLVGIDLILDKVWYRGVLL